MEAERILERSGQRGLEKIRRKVDIDRAIWDVLRRVVVRGIGGAIGSIFIPGDIGRSDRPLGDITIPDRIKRKDPILREVTAPDFPRRVTREAADRELKEIEARIPPRRAPLPARPVQPVRAPQRSRIPQRTRAPQRVRNPFIDILLGAASAAAVSSAISSATSPSTRSPATPFIDPIFPPQNIPLTPSQPTPLPSPMRLRTRTVDDLCRETARRRRKKKRKCEQRLNVVWAGGPNKGKIAGTKCATFEDTI